MSSSFSSVRHMRLEPAPAPEWRALASSVAAKLERISTSEHRDHDRQGRILQVVAAAGRRGVSQAEIAGALATSPSCVTRIIDRLEKEGLIDRRQHPTDRRINTVHVTPSGAAKVDQERRRSATAGETALARMSVAELAALDGLLSRIVTPHAGGS
ncbi:MarR family winged helix-turn-helix transcriptional regulator [Brevundimonas pondensis]|uniref:MarR family transcriptional regulator n=1 Tax=Brevundimonas pondensis TaxID=2774189 RepID=A0ABX7SHC5_9CAUL|nr:MarR family transcriptional regulator [Brevundimonas pondensis]